MRHFPLIVLAILATGSHAHSAGFVHNDNFHVFVESGITPSVAQDFAGTLMLRAEQYRRQIAEEWLGSPLPTSIGPATINVRFSDTEDTGRTWVIDHPDRKMHTVYLVTSADNALGGTLAHEMAHVVLATRFPHPHRLPAWLEEGIASRYDDTKRIQIRADVVRWWAETRRWPVVEKVLEAKNLHTDEQESYTVAASLVDMLIARGDKRKLIAFGQTAMRVGWQPALAQHYQISGSDQLQREWESWVKRTSRQPIQLSQR